MIISENSGWEGRSFILEPHLLFLSSSLHPPVSDAAVWHKSQHLPCEKKEKEEKRTHEKKGNKRLCRGRGGWKREKAGGTEGDVNCKDLPQQTLAKVNLHKQGSLGLLEPGSKPWIIMCYLYGSLF